MSCRTLLLFASCLLAAAVFVSSSEEIKQDEGVLVLNKNNFKQAVESNEFILVEFYAPWCGHCKALAPEFVKAAASLAEKDPSIKLAKVDATEETELAEQHNVRGYPTLKFFKNGVPVDYMGGRQADDIVNWLVKKTGPPAKTLTSVDDLKAFIDANNVAVVGFLPDRESEIAKTFLSVADVVDDQQFAIVSDTAIFPEFQVEGEKVVLFKKFDETAYYSGENTEEALKKFITTESLPLIVEFNHETAQKIFGGEIKSHLLLFLSKEAGHFEKYLEPVKPISKQYRDKILFVVINSDEPDHQRILEFFGMKESEVPAMRVIRLEEDMSKFKPEVPELGPGNIQSFIEAFLEGKLKEHLLSQDLPDDWNEAPVKVLVSTNFDEVAFDKSKDVLVEFYAPWCGHCKQLTPVYDKLGEAFKDKEDVVIAKMDATANELEHTKITSFPTIKLYSKGENKVVEYNGERTLEGLKKFLETGGEYGQAVPEDVEEESEDDDVPRKDEL